MSDAPRSVPDAHESSPYDDFRNAAIDAELQVGDVEETRKQAWYHVLVRLGRMAFGFVLVLAGLAMMVLPGPGAIVMAGGLVILSRDVKWADRLLRFMRRKMPGLEEEGPIPKSTIVVSLMLMVAAGLGGYWWLNGGQEWVSDLF